MTMLTPQAQQRLDQYLRHVRLSLQGCRSVSPDEVERDIREHIEGELAASSEEVSLGDLEPVLERLGSPSQWMPDQEISWRRRFLQHLRNGPEDWRLAYLALALLVAGCVFQQLLVPFALAAFLASRAALASARARNQELGAQKWLVYPSLIAVDGGLVFMLLLGLPLCIGGYFIRRAGIGAADSTPDFSVMSRKQIEVAIALLLGVVAAWWIIMASVVWIWPRPVREVLRPFADSLERGPAKALVCLGLGLGVLCGVTMLIVTRVR